MTETLVHPEAPSADVRPLLQTWAENPPDSLSTALAEKGVDVSALEDYARSGISTEEVETLRRVLVQGAASGNPEDAGLLARLTPLLDPRERAWERVIRAKNSGEILSATVTEATKGGVVVDLGVRGFVPASQIGLNVPRNLNQFVGRELKLRVLEVDRRRQTVILSNRQIMEEERADKRREVMGRLEEGQVRPGTVRRLTDIGAFVDVGGVDGLLHVSEISWKRVEHPSEVLKVGQKIQVKVLRVDPGAGRISLSMRRLTADPWEEARRKYAVGSIVGVKIGKLVPQGAEVEMEEGLDGFIPISELAGRRVASPEEVVQPGQEVQALVIDFRPRERKIVFSLRKLEQKKERQNIDDYQKKVRRTSDRTTLGDLFGHLFEEYQHPDDVEEGAPSTTGSEAASNGGSAGAAPAAAPAVTEDAATEETAPAVHTAEAESTESTETAEDTAAEDTTAETGVGAAETPESTESTESTGDNESGTDTGDDAVGADETTPAADETGIGATETPESTESTEPTDDEPGTDASDDAVGAVTEPASEVEAENGAGDAENGETEAVTEAAER